MAQPEIVDAGKIDRHGGEVDLFALGIGFDVADQLGDPGRSIACAPPASAPSLFEPTFDGRPVALEEAEPGQAGLAPGDADEAERGFEDHMSGGEQLTFA